GILINVCGSPSLSLHEVHEASSIIQKAAAENANIIFGAVQDEAMKDAVKITVIAAGFKEANKKNAVQRPQFMPQTWKAGRAEQSPASMAAVAGAASSAANRESRQDVVQQVQQNVRDVAREVPSDDLDVPTFLRRQASKA